MVRLKGAGQYVSRGQVTIAEAQEAADVWVTDYNEFRPHESLGDKTPTEFRPRIFNSGISSFGLST